jgi:hypothetical protein
LPDHELELDTDRLPTGEWNGNSLMYAIDRAREYDQVTWLTAKGKRIAAIVPVACVPGGGDLMATSVRVTVEADGRCAGFLIRDIAAGVLEWPLDVIEDETTGRKELGRVHHLRIQADVPAADFTGWLDI